MNGFLLYLPDTGRVLQLTAGPPSVFYVSYFVFLNRMWGPKNWLQVQHSNCVNGLKVARLPHRSMFNMITGQCAAVNKLRNLMYYKSQNIH
jgi:hypothetical protein